MCVIEIICCELIVFIAIQDLVYKINIKTVNDLFSNADVPNEHKTMCEIDMLDVPN